ncbi:hypothetical protein [uncultured Chryseobacterium sp.]|jgi:hypothetical protein|uniref:hypothetical protein n=1 Tax=uncultured Chryseobacterium sp. TaxID=259322 RepID=UPI002608838D|nr:hypothetical protein [uncultured Chryseobacterium sp.]
MKNILFVSSLTMLLLSCKQDKSKNEDLIENAAENTTSSIPIKRLSNIQSMVDAVYYEQIKNSEDLKKFDEKFHSLQEDSRKMNQMYNDIIGKSDDYYSDAEIRAKGIKDSVLKKQIISLLKDSSIKYNVKVEKLKELKNQININYYKLYGFYDAFKIRKTLPEIEKYQNAHPLKTDNLDNFIKKQNALLSELKSLK